MSNELDDILLLNKDESNSTIVVFGRDLSSYLIALILKQHGHQVAIVSQSNAPIMTDLYEFISMKYLFETAERIRSIRLLKIKGIEIEFDWNWQKLTNDCKQEFIDRKQKLEQEIVEKNIPIYEGKIIMVEDHILRIITEDESAQIAILRTKNVIVGSDICRSISKNNQNQALNKLNDIIQLNQLPKSLIVIGGGTLGLSVASCLKEIGCDHVTIIERQAHCLMDINDIDRELAAYIESILIKQEIDIVTNCTVHSLKADYQFIAVGTKRKLCSIQTTPTISIIQLIEKVSFGRQVQIATTLTPIIPIDYQRVKSICSMEQGISIAYRTISKCFGCPTPSFSMPSFVYTVPPLLILGQTHIPADNMFICRVSVPPTLKYAIDTPHQGFGKFWISRTRRLLCGVQFISEHASMFGKAFGILIRNQLSLDDICTRIELPGSVGEAVQLMIKQALRPIPNMKKT